MPKRVSFVLDLRADASVLLDSAVESSRWERRHLLCFSETTSCSSAPVSLSFSALAELVTSSHPRFLPISHHVIPHTGETNRQMSYFLPPAELHPPTGVDLLADPRSCPQSVTPGLFNLASEHRSATISCLRCLRGLEIDHSQLSNCVAWDCAHAYLCVSIQVSEWKQREGIL